MPLDRTWLLAHLPHQGSMCLLHHIDAWNARCIRCTAASHRAQDNPLRAHGRLGAACGIEYAAQAMAAHGALLAAPNAPPRAGYLTSARGVELHVARLDDINADLIIEAECLSGDDSIILYGFSISAGERLLLTGRITVVLDAAKLRKPT
ncbi:MAG: 3-hydroxylacyl-ACP dehydratase [Chromatiaceae bacterium]|nr:3-hydroxylacyl-ACP dehydratase [Chromatiaceae bacterium]